MNRHDLIQATARDIASNVHADPTARDRMADDLIKLCGLMINATGKYVSSYDEREMNDACDDAPGCGHVECDIVQHRTMYATGERIMSSVDEIVAESTNPEVNLERWDESSLDPWCACRHHPDCHTDAGCNGETVNGKPCEGGPCTGFRPVPWPKTGGWTYEDRRPDALRRLADPGTLTLPFIEPHCNCCAGPCIHGSPAPGPERCCVPLGVACPVHC